MISFKHIVFIDHGIFIYAFNYLFCPLYISKLHKCIEKVIFHREESPFEEVSIKLKEINNSKNCVYTNIDTDETFEGPDTLKLSLKEKRSYTIIEYTSK